MISYKPLVETMIKRSMIIDDLAKVLKIDRTTIYKEFGGESIQLRTDTLGNVCKALNCGVNEIIEWREDKVVGVGLITVDWEKVKEVIKAKGYSCKRLSLDAGLSFMTIANAIRLNQKINVFNLLKICKLLDLDIYEVVK